MIHGGDIYGRNIKYDFSVNVNPLGMPDFLGNVFLDKGEFRGFLESYPDYQYRAEREALAAYLESSAASGSEECSITPDMIVPGNGASELITAVINALNPKKVFIPAPSFYGYERAAAGRNICFYVMNEERGFLPGEDFIGSIPSEAELIIISNPNNPTGRLYRGSTLLKLFEYGRKKGIRILLDECFIELTDRKSMVYLAEKYPNVIFLRAFTKCFAIPGARIGYLVTKDEELRGRIRTALPEWNVSGTASLIIRTVADNLEAAESYLGESMKKVREGRNFLSKSLTETGIKVYPSDTNFILFKSSDNVYERLLEKEILIRDCSNFVGLGTGFYRISVRNMKENRVLVDSLGYTSDKV
ncbi:MAG: aminotransferase class I/II-fold pyridoxal phosphate-dependent enzyme [Eubacterium sp.]|nr:aminotransferase class I/II-fold pyridoxal phosphate-dependent enzyme [Eubacterium sp.]